MAGISNCRPFACCQTMQCQVSTECFYLFFGLLTDTTVKDRYTRLLRRLGVSTRISQLRPERFSCALSFHNHVELDVDACKTSRISQPHSVG